ELVGGGVDFLSYVRPKGAARFDEEHLRDALAQLARGLCALHDGHTVHRDVKHSNVLVAPDGRVVILDFGIAQDMDRVATNEGVVGTALYVAPDHPAEDPVGPAADR